MPYKQIKGDFPEVWDFSNLPEVECKLIEKKSGVGKYNKMLYTIEENTTGEKFNVWGSSILDRQLAEVEEGSKIKITHKGTIRSKRWNKDMQNFEVSVWSD